MVKPEDILGAKAAVAAGLGIDEAAERFGIPAPVLRAYLPRHLLDAGVVS